MKSFALFATGERHAPDDIDSEPQQVQIRQPRHFVGFADDDDRTATDGAVLRGSLNRHAEDLSDRDRHAKAENAEQDDAAKRISGVHFQHKKPKCHDEQAKRVTFDSER